MSGKRRATTELTKDNWDQEDSEPEDPGEFVRVDRTELAKRVIKKAKRSSITGDSSNASSSPFAGFRGFSRQPVAAKTEPPVQTTVQEEKGSGEDTAVPQGDYLHTLMKLNQGLLNWLKTHFEENPYCDFSPSFRDYERHFKALHDMYPSQAAPKSEEKPQQKQQPTFLFGKQQTNGLKEESKPPVFQPSGGQSGEPIGTTLFKLTSEPPSSTVSLFKSSSNPALQPRVEFKSSSNPAPSSESVGLKSSLTSSEPPSSTGSSELSKGSGYFASVPKTASVFGKESAKCDDSGKSPVTTPSSGGLFTQPASSSTPIFSFKSEEKPFSFKSEDKPFSFKPEDKPFSFSIPPQPPKESAREEAEEEYKPPEPEKGYVEEDALYSVRCKLFFKKDQETKFVERGVGNLVIKTLEDGKSQLLVRMATPLGNPLLNIRLASGLPASRLGTNNVALKCVPHPPWEDVTEPVTALIRVKTAQDADDLLEQLKTHQN